MAEPSNSNQIPNKPPELPKGEKKPAADPWDTADKYLNYFVGAVALMERLGNGLGMLAFTWATVVVLGGFSTDLGKDFWYATAIVFLEGFRVFSRESRSDDELLFKTTGSISLKRMKLSRSIPYYLTVSIVIICMYGTLEFSLRHLGHKPPPSLSLQYHILLLAFLLALASVAQAPTAAQYLKDNAWLQFLSSLVAVLALGAAMFWSHTPKHEVLLIIPPLFIGCLQTVFNGIGGLLPKRLRWDDLNPWLRMLVSLILPAWIVISVLLEFGTMGILILLGTVLLANIQIPVAVARVVLSAVRLSSKDNSHGTGNEHLLPALTIFYSMVLAQGVLYLAACILESLLSSHFRRSLARSCKLFNRQGYPSINVYYEYAYARRMQEGVLAQEDMNLANFVLNSLDSNSNEKKLAAVQILDSLLCLQGNSYAKLVSEITTSTKVVATLISMLGWTASYERDDGTGINIRYFTTKVIASLAGDLRIVAIPGTMQKISSLLDHIDAKNKKAKQDISNQISSDKNELNTNDNQQRSHPSSTVVNIQGEHGSHHAQTDGQQLSEQVDGGNKTQRSNVKSSFNWISYMLDDLPDGNEPSKDIDWFPMQGMLILEKLTHDLDNCGEINKAIGLIPKIIGFIINSTNTTKNVMIPALKLIEKLVNTEDEELGETIRKKIFRQRFFFNNLVEILEDNDSQTTQWKLVMVIIAKIIIEDGSNDIKKFCIMVPKLVHALCLGPDASSDKHFDHHTLRTLAGQALSKLVEKNGFCKTIFDEKGYSLIGDLKNMLKQDEYTCMAARLLMSLCLHCQDKLHNQQTSEQLSSILQVVLEKILYAENKQLEFLIKNASELYSIIPSQFAHELVSHTSKEKIVQKLVGALNSNNKICGRFPRMRRVIVEITISIVRSCPHYSPIFKSNGMIEALSKVQKVLEMVKKYEAFLGKVATQDFDNALPPPELLTTTKKLIGYETPNPEANIHVS